jgi:hypothetical protein
MRIRVGGILASLAIALAASASPAFANSWAGSDPAANFPMPYIPQLCWRPPTGDPTGAACIDWSVDVLNQARATMGLPAYVLPSDFDSLTPAQQLLVLTDADRAAYGLAPIPGLTAQLNQDADSGVQANADPWPSSGPWMAYTSNWAGGYVNVVQAYEGWMYDDGPGSGNQDCTTADPGGCWGHRHDVLWQFNAQGGPTAMGAAAGSYATGTPSYAMLLVQGSDSTYQPTYTYTWSQAVSDGAAGGTGSDTTGTGSSSGSATGSSGAGSSGSGTTSSTGSGTSDSGPAGSPGSGTTGSTGSGSSGSTVVSSGSGSGVSGSGTSGSGTSSSSGSGTTSTSSGTGTGSTGSFPIAHGSRSGHEPGAHVAQVSVAVARIRIRGHHVRVHLAVSRSLKITCSLRHWNGRRWRTARSKSCAAWAVFRHVAAGRYRLRVRSVAGTLSRRLVVR